MIDTFNGKHRWLSNFANSPIYVDSIRYPTVEHAYQAYKSLDIETRKRIAILPTPGQAKRAGKGLVLREDWEEIKFSVMYCLLKKKFKDPILRKRLLETGDEILIEGNTWGDKIWGCVKENGEWVGSNKLGLLLMRVRREIREDLY